MAAPEIHLTNWSSRGFHRGRRWTIMAKPREWELGEGWVECLCPTLESLLSYREGHLDFDQYQRLYLVSVPPFHCLAPGQLQAELPDGGAIPVEPGDTLLCCCSKTEALRGRCHRVWAGELLRKAGWQPTLDGRPMKGVDEEWRPILG